MNTVSRWLAGAVVIALLAIARPAAAYDPGTTHWDLTDVSAQKSVMHQDPDFALRLGLLPWHLDYYRYLMKRGAVLEDNFPRSLHHFYDPVNKRGLSFFWFVEVGKPSYKWILEDEGTHLLQDNSLADARAYLTRALTYKEGTPAESTAQRGRALASFFQSLGHVVHHVQDMAQPQHVRNDDHLDIGELLGLNPLYKPSLYEKYTREQEVRVRALAQEGVPVYTSGSTGSPYKTARDFWFNDSEKGGISQFTNKNFLSAGTNFTMFMGQPNTGTFKSPAPLGQPVPMTTQEFFSAVNQETPTNDPAVIPPEIQALCTTQTIDCSVTMYSTEKTPRASTLSIFDQDLRAKGLYVTYNEGDLVPTYSTQRLFSLNRLNLKGPQQLLIPEAVSYSAGLLNHFFRGKLKVEPPGPPDLGPYAVVDHSTGAGFKKVRARVTNASPEKLSEGTLTAIALFRVNNCYVPDLTGEFKLNDSGELVAPCAGYRSAEEHIRLAAPQTHTFDVAQGKELTFEFADAIPLNATDLILQVYFKGKVGEEADVFALGAADLSEPTFVTVMNATDNFELPVTGPPNCGASYGAGKFYYWTDILANIGACPYLNLDFNKDGYIDLDPRGGTISYGITVDGQRVANVALPEGRFARLAVLVKPTTYVLTLAATGNGFGWTSAYTFMSKRGQVEPEGNYFIVTPVDDLRSQAMHFSSVSYYHYWPVYSAPVDSMLPSKATDATTLFPVNMLVPTSQLEETPAFAEVMRPLPPPEHEVAADLEGANELKKQPPAGVKARSAERRAEKAAAAVAAAAAIAQ